VTRKKTDFPRSVEIKRFRGNYDSRYKVDNGNLGHASRRIWNWRSAPSKRTTPDPSFTPGISNIYFYTLTTRSIVRNIGCYRPENISSRGKFFSTLQANRKFSSIHCVNFSSQSKPHLRSILWK